MVNIKMRLPAGFAVIALPALTLALPGSAQADGAVAACTPGKSAALLTIRGFKSDVGMVRAQAYGSDPGEFLAKGKWIERVEAPRNGKDPMTICLPLPRPGRYAIAVRHDANDNGKSDWNDGGGFSRNPNLSVFNTKPDYDKVVIEVGDKPKPVEIVMQYRRGLSIRPLN